MIKLFITDGPHILVKKDGSETLLTQPVYNVTDEHLLSKNGFYKCSDCKNWFDKITTFNEHHPKFVKHKQYCAKCETFHQEEL